MPVEIKYKPYQELVIKDYKYEPSTELAAALFGEVPLLRVYSTTFATHPPKKLDGIYGCH